MKKFIIAVVLSSSLLFSCFAKGSADEEAQKETDAAQTEAQVPDAEASKADTSYAFGMMMGTSFNEIEVDLDYKAFAKGFEDMLEKRDMKFTEDEATALVQSALMLAMEKKMETIKQEELTFLDENGKKDGIVTTESGLQYEVITEGTGAKATAEDLVSIHYEGTLRDGSIFDSSFSRGEPAVFQLNQVIPGWAEGIQLMSVGSKYKFYIPSELAYGEQGIQDFIPAYATLIFDVEFLEIVDPETAE